MQNRFPKPTHLNGFKWRGLFLFLLVVTVLASLLAIVHVQHKIRFMESQYYQAMQDTLEAREEWGRLMLEKRHLSAPARVEQIAKSRLNMTSEKTNYQYIYIAPQTVELQLENPSELD